MRFTRAILVTALCISVVSSNPLPGGEGLQSQIVEQKVNMIATELFRILGPVFLRNALGKGGAGGGGGGGSKEGSGTTVTLAGPVFDDDFDDDSISSKSGISEGGSKVKVDFATFPPDEDDLEDIDTSTKASEDEVEDMSTSRKASDNPSSDVNPEAENQVSDIGGDHQESAAESQNNEVRVQFADDAPRDAASEASEPALAPLEDIEVSDDENRNKRFLNFGGISGGTDGAAAGGGSGAGSGNFLFDIIRQAADGAARAAGTVFRVVAGTQSLGLGLSASRDVGPAPPPAAPAAPGAPPAPAAPAAAPAPGNATKPSLVAGSGSAGSSGQPPADPAAGAPSPGGAPEAVPGPVTRLFVIANRGISNLIQDLILRLAATSERIVNFKARLITSII
ncbi:sal-like protein 3 [Belonocnema kinseyi]|uniref:sal-like protein 3 n=1 Tax=Belonocnema kinseyi TaxID=2817044 RepID=UPI00143DFBE9|nr:sal-like protein 3 [Belonocnema kinseyi]